MRVADPQAVELIGKGFTDYLVGAAEPDAISFRKDLGDAIRLDKAGRQRPLPAGQGNKPSSYKSRALTIRQEYS